MAGKADLELFSRGGSALPSMMGRWVNELGSTMTVTAQAPDGHFSGAYTSAVSGTGQQVHGPVQGFVTNDSVGWVVDWTPTFRSTTSWAGKILRDPTGAPMIYTLWNLSRELADPAEDWWESFLSGSDRFERLGP
ncbi:MAG: avidin/streptavidin family protein [Pseudomonadota bacterium]